MNRYAIGIHVGTESVRVLVVDIRTGRVAGRADQSWPVRVGDWVDSLSTVCRSAMAASGASAEQAVGIGLAFSACRMLRCQSDGTPLDSSDTAPPATLQIDAGDWLVWQLIGGVYPLSRRVDLVRSTCQAGFGPAWGSTADRITENITAELSPSRLAAPGTRAGGLSSSAAERLGLRQGIAVSAAIIDAHACLPGAGVAAPSTMLLIFGAISLQVMNSRINASSQGIATAVQDGILPGYIGYQTRPTHIGDALARLARSLGQSQELLTRDAAHLAPGSGGVMLSGERAFTADGPLNQAFVGLSSTTTPAQIYRAALEAWAFGIRSIRETLQAAGVPVRRFVAVGRPPIVSPVMLQILADVLGDKISLAGIDQPAARGAAILGCLAAGPDLTGYPAMSLAIAAMTSETDQVIFRPDLPAKKAYAKLYPAYQSRAAADR